MSILNGRMCERIGYDGVSAACGLWGSRGFSELASVIADPHHRVTHSEHRVFWTFFFLNINGGTWTLLRANFKIRRSGKKTKRNRETAAEACIQSLLDQCHLKS